MDEMTEAATPLKIAVLGTASASLRDVPFGDESWKIWSLGFNASVIPRGDKWFELHNEGLLSDVGLSPDAIKLLQQAKTDLVVQKRCAMFPDATEYPLALVLSQFPRRYFTSSIAWVLALAIMANPREIGIFGADMCDKEEYAYQRGACEYLIGIAEGRGIKVTLSAFTPLCRASRMYAFEDIGVARELAVRNLATKEEMARREDAYTKERDAFNFWRGRNFEIDALMNRWG